MIEKIKKDRRLFAICGAVAFAVAIGSSVAVIALVLSQNYLPMWFLLALSAVGFYATPFLSFASADRNTAIALVNAVNELGTTSVSEVANKLGWREKPTESFIKKCQKWGYLSTSDEQINE